MTEDSKMTIDDFKKMYYSDDDPEHNRKVLFEMAAICRNMVSEENRLRNDRTTWFLTVNGFLFTALGITLASGKVTPVFLIFVSLVFAILGYILAICIYQNEMNIGSKAIYYIHVRWLGFLETFFGYSPSANELNTIFYVPPIMGFSVDRFVSRLQERSCDLGKFRIFRLSNLVAFAWILLFCVVLIFNAAPCLRQSVSPPPTSSASQGDAANSPLTTNN